MRHFKLFALTLSLAAFLFGCDASDTTQTQTTAAESVIVAPILEEAKILQVSGLEIVKRYDLDDGHGIYVQQSPDAAIEFRTSPAKINLALRTFPEAGYEEKNAEAQRMITKLASVITGTDGKLIDDAISGKIEPGEHVINGLPVNVSFVNENNLLVTISK